MAVPTGTYAGAKELQYLTWLSRALLAIGIVVLLAALVANLDPIFLLVGGMFVLTGAVKMLMMEIWTRRAKLGTPDHDPVQEA